ncbi:arylamine N-acetyltransferase [Microbulbifer echini]|uniref:Arylamine N-acetyltransferase n=1 Tax=Microbulbifer echini TaxID=1529067 RepID=A0ABV4NQ93_9GAMM
MGTLLWLKTEVMRKKMTGINYSRQQITSKYLADLGLSLEIRDIDFLAKLQSKHIARYSFNSLAVVLGQKISLDLPMIFDKIVERKRGGYCFEHNKLVFNILEELGFEVRLLLAKVVNGKSLDVPRTHRVNLLNFQGDKYIVDAGFGFQGPFYPIKLEVGLEQRQGDTCYRVLAHENGDYCFQILKDNEFLTLYTFDLRNYSEAECLPAHFYSCNYPSAVFVQNLVVSRKCFDDVKSLRNGDFYRRHKGKAQITKVSSSKILHRILSEDFELDLDFAVAEFLYSKFIDE